ncbi:MAG TPA: helix-turn-helix transcriptional regulator [Sphingobium sp.]|nr:helix-turn-helix transcriptional regulator [Sphingobium sp.]
MIRAEEIYDAATDDAAFDALASTLANAFGARSGVLHWGNGANEAEEVSYSGYFSPAHMATYDLAFQSDDLWAEAMDRPGSMNRAWDCERFVPAATYERSRIYNEWIRPMGDDTFHCLGGVVRQGQVQGKVGLHRGRAQKSFTAAEVQSLHASLGHISRMFAIRSKLGRATYYGRSLHATLDMVGHGVFILGPGGILTECNRAGERMLRRGDALLLRNRHVKARDVLDDDALQTALKAAAAADGSRASAIFLHREQGMPYVLSVAAARIGDVRQIILIASHPDDRDASLTSRIRALYGLTNAEAEVAQALTTGKPLEQLAAERGVALNTVRTQMKAIYAKLDCSRQSELVARISQLPRLGSFEDGDGGEG